MPKLCRAAAMLAGSLLLLGMPAAAQPHADGPMGWNYGWSWGHMIFGMLMMILFWGGVIAAIVLLVRWLGTGSSATNAPAPIQGRALEILKERFARGEIDREEFEERKRLLSD
jgi:putative membrane protein